MKEEEAKHVSRFINVVFVSAGGEIKVFRRDYLWPERFALSIFVLFEFSLKTSETVRPGGQAGPGSEQKKS